MPCCYSGQPTHHHFVTYLKPIYVDILQLASLLPPNFNFTVPFVTLHNGNSMNLGPMGLYQALLLYQECKKVRERMEFYSRGCFVSPFSHILKTISFIFVLGCIKLLGSWFLKEHFGIVGVVYQILGKKLPISWIHSIMVRTLPISCMMEYI